MAKNGNELGDLVFDLVTLRSCRCVDLVHTYLPFEYGEYYSCPKALNVEYGDDQRSLRSANGHFKV